MAANNRFYIHYSHNHVSSLRGTNSVTRPAALVSLDNDDDSPQHHQTQPFITAHHYPYPPSSSSLLPFPLILLFYPASSLFFPLPASLPPFLYYLLLFSSTSLPPSFPLNLPPFLSSASSLSFLSFPFLSLILLNLLFHFFLFLLPVFLPSSCVTPSPTPSSSPPLLCPSPVSHLPHHYLSPSHISFLSSFLSSYIVPLIIPTSLPLSLIPAIIPCSSIFSHAILPPPFLHSSSLASSSRSSPHPPLIPLSSIFHLSSHTPAKHLHLASSSGRYIKNRTKYFSG